MFLVFVDYYFRVYSDVVSAVGGWVGCLFGVDFLVVCALLIVRSGFLLTFLYDLCVGALTWMVLRFGMLWVC